MPFVLLVRSLSSAQHRTDAFAVTQSYEVIIVSPSFAGKTTLKKHREGSSQLPVDFVQGDELIQLAFVSQSTTS